MFYFTATRKLLVSRELRPRFETFLRIHYCTGLTACWPLAGWLAGWLADWLAVIEASTRPKPCELQHNASSE